MDAVATIRPDQAELSDVWHVRLLTEDELATVEGGVLWQAALYLLLAGGAAAGLGVIAGVALYYYLR